MVSSSPTTVALTCWSTYAPSNAQEWPCLDQGQRLSFELVRDERIARTCAENLAPVRALHAPYVRHRWAAEPWGPVHAPAAMTSSRLPSAPTRTIGGIWSGKTAGRGGRLPA